MSNLSEVKTLEELEKREKVYSVSFLILINVIFFGVIFQLDENYFENNYWLVIIVFIYFFILFLYSVLFSYYKYPKSDKTISFWKFFNTHPYYTRTHEESLKIEKNVTPYLAGFIVIGSFLGFSFLSYELFFFEFEESLNGFLSYLILGIICIGTFFYYSYVFYKHFHDKHTILKMDEKTNKYFVYLLYTIILISVILIIFDAIIEKDYEGLFVIIISMIVLISLCYYFYKNSNSNLSFFKYLSSSEHENIEIVIQREKKLMNILVPIYTGFGVLIFVFILSIIAYFTYLSYISTGILVMLEELEITYFDFLLTVLFFTILLIISTYYFYKHFHDKHINN